MPPPPDAARWHLSAELLASFEGAVAPGGLFAVSGLAELALHDDTLFVPAFRLGLVRSASASTELEDGATASFVWTAALVDACPLAVRRGAFALMPCLRGELGALEGEGERIAPARDATRLWAAVTTLARASWTFYGPLSLELGAGARWPLYRTRFFFQPDTTIYRTPAVGLTVGGGLGLRIL